MFSESALDLNERRETASDGRSEFVIGGYWAVAVECKREKRRREKRRREKNGAVLVVICVVAFVVAGLWQSVLQRWACEAGIECCGAAGA